jgi:hypothetical protein
MGAFGCVDPALMCVAGSGGCGVAQKIAKCSAVLGKTKLLKLIVVVEMMVMVVMVVVGWVVGW